MPKLFLVPTMRPSLEPWQRQIVLRETNRLTNRIRLHNRSVLKRARQTLTQIRDAIRDIPKAK